MSALLRVLATPPLLVLAALLGGGYSVYLRYRSLLRQRSFTEEWETTKRAEDEEQRGRQDEWVFRPDRADREEARRRQQEAKSDAKSSGRRGGAGGGGGGNAGTRATRGGRKPPRVDSNDLYAVLGVARTASANDIRDAFRRELLKYHPDHNAQADWDVDALHERTRLIIEAHKTLRNAQKRQAYDSRFR
jgi:hypothetical protein